MNLEKFGIRLSDGFPSTSDVIVVGMGCFWGAERRYWTSPGVIATAVGYAGGTLDAPTYQQVCTGRTGHAEVVLAVFDTTETSYADMLRIFWENHDPTQGDRQGADVGPQYRSAIYWITDEQRVAAEASRAAYQEVLTAAGYGPITTEIAPLAMFHPAEEYHQKYLAKNPNGYCGLGGTGVACPVGIAG